MTMAANGSATATMTHEDALASQYLSSSISSLSSARSQSSLIARTYRHAAQLFLTRRLSEALSTIEPIVQAPGAAQKGADGYQEEDDEFHVAPVASSSRGTRIKVWSLYLTLLNAIVELGPEEGKLVFGSSKWKALANKAKEGSIWDDVLRLGYHDVEGDVDGDVVINLYEHAVTIDRG